MSRGLLLVALLLISGCEKERAEPPVMEHTLVFECTQLLIGLDTAYCHEDIVGPGLLRIYFLPDPKETSWELGVRGLAALAEQCEFRGQFDQTRLSALQGRGETEIVCPITGNVNRQYHELSFENRLETTNTSISITVNFSR